MPHRFEVQIPLIARGRHRRRRAARVRRGHRRTWSASGCRRPTRSRSSATRGCTTRSTTRPWSTGGSAVQAAGGYGDLPLMEDYALFARMLQNGARAVNVAEPLVYYRVGATAFKRRGGADLLRSELRLQRGFRRQRFTTPAEYVRNVMVRGGYRLIPWWAAPRGIQADGRALHRPPGYGSLTPAEGDPAAQPAPPMQVRPVNVDLVVVGSGFFGLTDRRALRQRAGPAGARPRPPPPHRRQRLQRARAGDRHRGAPVRRAPVPHLERAGLGVRQPVHRVHRLPAPGLQRCTRARSTRCRSTWARSTSSSAQAMSPGRGARADRRAGRARSTPAEATNLEEKAISLIGRPLYEAFIRGYTAKQWQTDPTELPPRSSPGCRSATPSTTATSTTPTRACRSTATPRGWSGWPTTRTSRSGWTPTSSTCATSCVGKVPDRLHRAGRRVLRQRRGRAGLAHARLRAPRSLPTGDFQGTPVMNYTDEDVPYTRIHEFRHFHPERDCTRRTRP